jgi:hypothetical protein
MSQTDGDLEVGNDVSQSQIAIGKNNRITTSYQTTNSWREFVRRDLESLEKRLLILLVAVMCLYLLGALATGLTIRQVDMLYTRLDRIEDRIAPQPYQPWMPSP